MDYTGYQPESPTIDGPTSAPKSTEDYTVQLQLAAAAAEGMQLDPALVDAGRQQGEQDAAVAPRNESPATEQEREEVRTERRAQLMREAEMMRAALRAKEREIDDLT